MELLKIRRGSDNIHMIYNGVNMISEVKKRGNLFFEQTMLEAISKLPYRKGVWLDIGANVGNHTVFFSRYCNPDEVWSYEPNAGSFEILKANVKANCTRTVRLFNCAIGAEKGFCNFSDNENPAINKVIPGDGLTKMETITTTAKVALIKVDVEGFETEVLKGAKDVIARDLPELFIEHFGEPEELLPLLPDGYKIIKRYNNAPTWHYSA